MRNLDRALHSLALMLSTPKEVAAITIMIELIHTRSRRKFLNPSTKLRFKIISSKPQAVTITKTLAEAVIIKMLCFVLTKTVLIGATQPSVLSNL